jgi:hypothetical protein
MLPSRFHFGSVTFETAFRGLVDELAVSRSIRRSVHDTYSSIQKLNAD